MKYNLDERCKEKFGMPLKKWLKQAIKEGRNIHFCAKALKCVPSGVYRHLNEFGLSFKKNKKGSK
jgi:hypothetical protein